MEAYRQRANAAHAGPVDIDTKDEALRVVQVSAAGLGDLPKVRGAALDGHGRLKNADLVQVNALAERQGVIDYAVRKAFVFEPYTWEGVPFHQADDRMQARLLKASSEQGGQVQAGTEV